MSGSSRAFDVIPTQGQPVIVTLDQGTLLRLGHFAEIHRHRQSRHRRRLDPLAAAHVHLRQEDGRDDALRHRRAGACAVQHHGARRPRPGAAEAGAGRACPRRPDRRRFRRRRHHPPGHRGHRRRSRRCPAHRQPLPRQGRRCDQPPGDHRAQPGQSAGAHRRSRSHGRPPARHRLERDGQYRQHRRRRGHRRFSRRQLLASSVPQLRAPASTTTT